MTEMIQSNWTKASITPNHKDQKQISEMTLNKFTIALSSLPSR